ncbi:MAG: AI-2E family transporter [Chloroflexi bacterium]|nr:AI-2E family transporter [Chloroflexota bacterium]
MSDERVYRIAAVLVGFAASLLILERLWSLALLFQDIILLFALAWLVSFALAPVVEWFERPYYPSWLYRRIYTRIHPLSARTLLPHGASVAVVYISLVVLIVWGMSGLIPIAIEQSVNLVQQLPELPRRLPQMALDLQAQLIRLGLDFDLVALYQTNLATRLNELGLNAFRDLLGALSTVAATFGNLLLVLILSLYMNLGGRSLSVEMTALMPRRYRREVVVFAQSVNKTFGGFIRGQLLQAFLVGIATAVVMLIVRVEFVVLAATLSALLMLIPLIGAPLALVPPVAIAAFQGSLASAFIAFALMFVVIQILTNAIMPKIFAESVGLHPLLVFAALLIGIRIGGLWGAFFGIPIAGVLYAMIIYIAGRLRAEVEERKAT